MLAVYLFRATSGAHHQEGLVMTLTASSSSRAVTNSPVVVALDYHNRDAAMAFVDKIDPRDCRLKVGKEMFTLFGPQFVRELQQRGFDIFLDLKFHDIPNTAAHAVAAAADLGVWMVNVHASGGARMMTAAREALVPFGKDAPLLIAVTVLTSMEASDLADLGVTLSPADYAERLAALTQKCGLDGVVCSAQEAVRFKQVFGQEFKLVTPGIRPQGSDAGDQRRIMTPEQALAAGVDYMVIGRPVTPNVPNVLPSVSTAPPNAPAPAPIAVLRSRLDQLEQALRDIARVIARTAAVIFLLVTNIILSPEFMIHGSKLSITIIAKNKPGEIIP